MGKVNGSKVLAKALKQQGVEVFWYITGGPMMAAEQASVVDQGIRGIDVRHEQAAAMAAHGYARVTRRPGVCMAASGPAATNLITGVENARIDLSPIVALGGASPVSDLQREAFQESDQLSMFKPCTKWAERVYHAIRMPELVSIAFRQAMSGRPGPVYLDLPGDVLYEEVEEGALLFPEAAKSRPDCRTLGDPDLVKEAVKLLQGAKRPLVVSGGGAFWSGAMEQLTQLVEMAGIPFFTTPQGRGVIPDDHRLSFLTARSTAFREADLLLVVGTRFNYMLQYGSPPRFAGDVKVIQIDIHAEEIGHNRAVDVGIVGDAASVLDQLVVEAEGKLSPRLYADWVERLGRVDQQKRAEQEVAMSTDATPIHPLRLCKEIRDYLDRDAILGVDGQEILNIARQAIPTFMPGHRLNSGPWGCLGVALPFAMGAKVAKPNVQVLALSGDGSFGLNAMELDTAVRHKIPFVGVVSNNSGWTGLPDSYVGRYLGYTRYDRMAEALGCYAEQVEKPEEIRPALKRAFDSGMPALLNVIVDKSARATTQKFADYRGVAAQLASH